jgi:hypothetical protein
MGYSIISYPKIHMPSKIKQKIPRKKIRAGQSNCAGGRR